MSDDNIKKPLSQWLEEFNEDTGTVSELTRKLAFAAIAIIWIFKNTEPKSKILPTELIYPLKLVVIALIIDVMQYVWRAINVYIIYKIKEWQFDNKKIKEEDIEDVKIPVYIEIVTWLLFLAKVSLVAVSYYYIYQFLINKV